MKPPAFDAEQSNRDLVDQASRLRDFLMLIDEVDCTALVDTLDVIAATEDPERADFKPLRAVLSQTLGQARPHVDQLTLEQVLRGSFHAHQTRRTFPNLILFILGFFFAAIIAELTFWTTNARSLIADAESFLAFDHEEKLYEAVELKNNIAVLWKQSAGPQDTSIRLATRGYLAVVDELNQHYNREVTLIPRIRNQAEVFAMLRRVQAVIDSYLDQLLQDLNARNASPEANDFRAEPRAEQPLVRTQIIDDFQWHDSDAGAAEVGKELAQRRAVMSAANRRSIGEYADTAAATQSSVLNLKSALELVEKWTLPFAFGIFGSLVYCMSRVLSFLKAPLDLFHIGIRALFSAIAAVVLGMLLIPSGAIQIETGVSVAFVYLLAFVFGYSIETFTDLLDRMNRTIRESLSIEPKSGNAP